VEIKDVDSSVLLSSCLWSFFSFFSFVSFFFLLLRGRGPDKSGGGGRNNFVLYGHNKLYLPLPR
jgi:hypothetical protein